MTLPEKSIQRLIAKGATDEQIALIAEWCRKLRDDPASVGAPEFIAFAAEYSRLFITSGASRWINEMPKTPLLQPLPEASIATLRANGATDKQVEMITEWTNRVHDDPMQAQTPEFIAFAREHYHLYNARKD